MSRLLCGAAAYSSAPAKFPLDSQHDIFYPSRMSAPPADKPWPHAPPHWLFEPGIYMVTASTC